MNKGWWGIGLAAGLLVAPVAEAHELECVKVVNGSTLIEVDDFPTTLNYTLTVRNIHPDSASEVLEATDPLLEGLGWEGFDTPFTLPFGGETDETFAVRVDDFEECVRLAALDGVADLVIDNTFNVRWDSGSDVCSAQVVCVPPNGNGPPPEGQEGRMTGGGSVFGTGQDRVTHGFQLRCDENDPRQNLQVNFQGNRFHLLDLTSAECLDTALDEGNPVAGFDTFVGEGTGRFNNVPGYTIEFTFTDDGEPGVDDTADIVIRDPGGDIVLDVEGELRFGNHQAHP